MIEGAGEIYSYRFRYNRIPPKSPKPQDTNGLGLFVFCGWRFPHVERGKVRLCLPENEPSLGREQ